MCKTKFRKKVFFCSIHNSNNFRKIVHKAVLKFSNYNGDGFKKVNPEDLLPYRIVISTLIHVGKFMRKYHPDVVFIDEAAQACEPEVGCAIAMLAKHNKTRQIVLAGDPHQLGPSLSSKISEKFGLGKFISYSYLIIVKW